MKVLITGFDPFGGDKVNPAFEAVKILPDTIAGAFVCNDVMYHVLYLINKKYCNVRGGFIHVPYALEQVIDKPQGTCAMSLETISKGLELAIKATIENVKDIILPDGSIM